MVLDNKKILFWVLTFGTLFAILALLFFNVEASRFLTLKQTCQKWVFTHKFSKIFNTLLVYLGYFLFFLCCTLFKHNKLKFLALATISIECGKLAKVLFSLGILGATYFIFAVLIERIILCFYLTASYLKSRNLCGFVNFKEDFICQLKLFGKFILVVIWQVLAIFVILNFFSMLF